MPIFKSIPIKKIINGNEITTSDSVIVTNESYSTSGESLVIVKEVEECNLFLDSNTTEHVVVKSMTYVLVKSDKLIDEEYEEVELNNGACVEFRKVGDYWYILSSDGLKNS
jgi:hypothetical protein